MCLHRFRKRIEVGHINEISNVLSTLEKKKVNKKTELVEIYLKMNEELEQNYFSKPAKGI